MKTFASNFLIAASACAILTAALPAYALEQVASTTPPAAESLFKASAKQISDFKADKLAWLKGFPIGGPQLSALVKSLVLADPSLADDLIVLAKQANPVQASAIGAGIGAAAKALFATAQPISDALAAKVAASGSDVLIAGYAQGAKDIATLAVPGAGATPSPAGGVGGFTGNTTGNSTGGSHPLSQPGSFTTPNTSQTFNFGGATVTCTASTSPRRSCL